MRSLVLSVLVLTSLTFIFGCKSSPPNAPVADTTAPIASIEPLEAEQTSLQFTITFQAEDEGSGVEEVEVFVKAPNADWASLGTYTEGPVTFIAEEPGVHGFVAVARDAAGNIQEIPTLAQSETIVPEPIIITDRLGEDFDITNAVLRHNMTARWWGHGIGRNTIRPINDPQFLLPGDTGYPRDNSTTDVIGVTMDGDFRAYGTDDIVDKEVVNDVIGGVHFAATF